MKNITMLKRIDVATAVRSMSRAAIGTVPAVRAVPDKRKKLQKLSKRDIQRAMEE